MSPGFSLFTFNFRMSVPCFSYESLRKSLTDAVTYAKMCNMEKFLIDGEELDKIKVVKSIRMSILEVKRLEERGLSVTEALRGGLDWVLSGGSSVSTPAVTSENVREWQSNPVWQKHVGYFIYAETLDQLYLAWNDFVNELTEEGYEPDPRMQAYCDPLYKKLGGSEETF